LDVHALLSSAQTTAECTQPVAGLQESVVHGSLSSQEMVVCPQTVPGSQESVVQALPSSQLVDVVEQVPVPLQTPAEVCISTEHIAAAQLSPACVSHCPPAVQVFLFPHDTLEHMPEGSTVPAVTFAHVPPAPVHVWHLPHELVPQQ
jgi:hypothetical protein